MAAGVEWQHQGGPMVRALGPHPARLADPKWNPHHIGAFDLNGALCAHGGRGLDGLVRPFGSRRFSGRTLAARAVVGAVHDPQTMNGEAAGMVPKAIADGHL